MTFNRKLSVLFIFAIALLLSACESVPIAEEEYKHSTRAGSDVQRFTINSYDQNCVSLRPLFQIKEKPVNGILYFKDDQKIIRASPAVTGRKDLCAGQIVVGRAAYYTPNDGFKGKDEMLMDIVFAGRSRVERKRIFVIVR